MLYFGVKKHGGMQTGRHLERDSTVSLNMLCTVNSRGTGLFKTIWDLNTSERIRIFMPTACWRKTGLFAQNLFGKASFLEIV